MEIDLERLIADARAEGLSSAEAATHALREAIVRGILVGGRPLRQDELAARLGVSKIPVREALRRLEAEGLVAFYPNRGAVVAPLSSEEAAELAEIRIALETAALRRAVPRAVVADLRRAQDILDEARQEPNAARWSALNREFHEALYAPADRPHLLELIRQVNRRIDRYMYVTLADAGHQAQSLHEHRLVLQAMRRGDAVAAEAALIAHIASGAERLIDYLRNGEQSANIEKKEGKGKGQDTRDQAMPGGRARK